MLLALGAALSGLALVSVARTGNYLAVAKRYRSGRRSPTRTSRRWNSGSAPGYRRSPLVISPASSANGPRRADSGHAAGPQALTDKELIGPGQAQIGLGIKKANLPALALHPGDQVLIVAIEQNQPENDTTPPQQFPATIVDANEATNTIDDTVLVHLAVAVEWHPPSWH